MVRRQHRERRLGFTLIELLVVVAIIAVLMALLLPAVQKVREAANRMLCGSNLKQIAIAVHNYHNDFLNFPPGGITPGTCCGTNSYTNWAIEILPYAEQQNLYRQYQQFPLINEGAANAFVRTQFVKVYNCASDVNTNMLDFPASWPGSTLQYARSSYRAVSGYSAFTGRVFWDACEPGLINQLPAPFTGKLPVQWRGLLHSVGAGSLAECAAQGGINARERFADILDGTSNTLMVGEYTTTDVIRRRTFWAYTYTSYNQSSISDQSRTLGNSFARCNALGGPGGDNPCKRMFGGMHPGGMNFVLCDGSLRFIRYTVDMQMLGAMATIAGRESNIVND